jgi:hypothetical protein
MWVASGVPFPGGVILSSNGENKAELPLPTDEDIDEEEGREALTIDDNSAT